VPSDADQDAVNQDEVNRDEPGQGEPGQGEPGQDEPERFREGQTVVRRGLHPDGRIAAVESARVIRDDESGLFLWVRKGSAILRRATLEGQPTRHLPWAEDMRLPTVLVPTAWRSYDTLMLVPPGRADSVVSHSVWWAWQDDGTFVGWYVNLESTAQRWSGGVDIHDYALDILVAPDRSFEWKDEDEFAQLTGHPFFWDEAGAKAIRAEGERVIALAAAGMFPFDGTWCDLAPDDGPPSALPWWWDLPGPGR
jgi:hypothetical protein